MGRPAHNPYMVPGKIPYLDLRNNVLRDQAIAELHPPREPIVIPQIRRFAVSALITTIVMLFIVPILIAAGLSVIILVWA